MKWLAAMIGVGAAGVMIGWALRPETRSIPLRDAKPMAPPTPPPPPDVVTPVTPAVPISSASSGPTSTEYDPVFVKYAGSIPVAYLRALAYRESGLKPHATTNASNPNAARGLLQVVGVVREDYNRVHGTHYQPDDLWDTDINVKIAVDALHRIMAAIGRHPSANLHPDWNNPEFVKLLTAAWNAGFSDSGGVGKVASYLEARGMPVTHDAVIANASAAGAVSYVGNAQRAAWHRSVAELYFKQPDAGPPSRVV